MMNAGSHFGEDEKLFPPYIIILIVWIALLIKYGVPIIKTFSRRKPDITRILVYTAVIILGLSYFYRILHLIIYYNDGSGLVILDIFYIIIKNISEGIFVTVIVSIAWGWSIVHLKHD